MPDITNSWNNCPICDCEMSYYRGQISCSKPAQNNHSYYLFFSYIKNCLTLTKEKVIYRFCYIVRINAHRSDFFPYDLDNVGFKFDGSANVYAIGANLFRGPLFTIGYNQSHKIYDESYMKSLMSLI